MIKPAISLQELQAKIGHRAKSAPQHRFWGLYVHIAKHETLRAAYEHAKRNRGAAGSDEESFESIEECGLEPWLTQLLQELHEGTYRPRAYRRREIPKEGGKTRTISIPTIRDRVVQGALRLILEPIFEADFSDSSMGGRPSRSAHQALQRVRQGLQQRQHYVADVDLSRFFDTIHHDRILRRIAVRVQDDKVMALIKQYLKSSGKRGLPQGSPLSPLLANLALNDLDHLLDRGRGVISYVRYLDDMVVLASDSVRGRAWVDRALECIRLEAEAIGVSLNADKTRKVIMTHARAMFAFLGFDFRWVRSPKTRGHYARMTPRRKKIIQIVRTVRQSLRRNRDKTARDAVAEVNPILRGWVNYFRVGQSTAAFGKVRYGVECTVRRWAAKQKRRQGLGWKRWSSDVVYGQWGLFNEYATAYRLAKARPTQKT
jgi:RNA-directed DNA polymerase